MAKAKTALFSLGSRGSLGNLLTTQKGTGSTILRSKPTPSDRYTLPQAYQRWLYEDYAYWWRQQSEATRQAYASQGVRFHLTGFQYWMKYNLTNLPDIAGIWHLDEKAGAVATDFSRNTNHGVITGPSPTDGVIDGAFLFDGTNDRVTVPTAPSLEMDEILSLSFFVTLRRTANYEYIIAKGNAWVAGWWIQKDTTSTNLNIKLKGNAANQTMLIAALVLDKPTHILITLNLPNWASFIDGVPAGSGVIASTSILGPTTYDLNFGSSPIPTYWSRVDLDHIILYNRQLDAADALRHSERSYPP